MNNLSKDLKYLFEKGEASQSALIRRQAAYTWSRQSAGDHGYASATFDSVPDGYICLAATVQTSAISNMNGGQITVVNVSQGSTPTVYFTYNFPYGTGSSQSITINLIFGKLNI